MLEQALDESQPLLERVKYCAFFSSHLDEFFGVRVAGLLDQAASGLNVRSEDGRTPRAALAEIRKRVEALNERQTRLWSRDLCPRSRARGSSSPGSRSSPRRSWSSSQRGSSRRSIPC